MGTLQTELSKIEGEELMKELPNLGKHHGKCDVCGNPLSVHAVRREGHRIARTHCENRCCDKYYKEVNFYFSRGAKEWDERMNYKP